LSILLQIKVWIFLKEWSDPVNRYFDEEGLSLAIAFFKNDVILQDLDPFGVSILILGG
jgi:hypothetical protein